MMNLSDCLKSDVLTNTRIAFTNTNEILDGFEPSIEKWLSAGEQQRYNSFTNSDHARNWLSGRIVAKQLIQKSFPIENYNPNDLSILSRNDANRGIAPQIWHQEQRIPFRLSISHVEDAVLVALAIEPEVRVGVDLTYLSSVEQTVQNMWFSENEKQLASTSPSRPAQIWAAKEATYKALNNGEPFHPLNISVEKVDNKICSCQYVNDEIQVNVSVKTWDISDQLLAAFVRV